MTDLKQTGNPMERSRDTLFDGSLHCVQHKDGYRFSLDAVLLAHFVCPGKEETLLDLGAGCGVVGLILLHRASAFIHSLTGFELQSGLARLAQENIRLNHFAEKMRVVEGDLRRIFEYFSPESFSTVVCNPPFYRKGRGRPSANEEALIARHRVACTLPDILAAASGVVTNRGRVVMIYPAEGMGTILGLLPTYRLTAKRLQMVYSYPESSDGARLVLLEAVKNGGEGMEVLSPFYIYSCKDGEYSPAMQRMYDPAWTFSR